MKNSRRGFVVPVLIVIIALTAISGAFYLYKNKKVEIPVANTNVETKVETKVEVNPTVTQKPPQTQIIPLNIDITGGMAEIYFIHTLLEGVTILGQQHVIFRDSAATRAMVSALDPNPVMGDLCSNTVVAIVEVKNPTIDPKHKTSRGVQLVDVDLVRVLSSSAPVHTCAQ